jgi:hypothetical protein
VAAQERSKGRQQRVPKERAQFTQLLRTNPNYFGTLEGAPLKAVKAKQGDSTYEELTCVGYHPVRGVLAATFAQKLGAGYAGGPCSNGSREYVRFFVDAGDGWNDVGIVGVKVTDLEPTQDCAGASIYPLTHTMTVDYSPRRRPCSSPQVVRVRTILSWNVEPPAGQPNHVPVWGSVHECTVQIAPRLQLSIVDLIDKSVFLNTFELPEPLLAILDHPIPVPPPPEPPLEVLATDAKKAKVPPSRFAFATAMKAVTGPEVTGGSLQASQALFKDLKLDLGKILVEIEKTSGDVRYEELECIGLDEAHERLVATYRVKLSSGYSGSLCSKGSKEYVAFWADWDDTCEWTYLGAAEVAAHDLQELPDGGLCYSAQLPVDLEPLRRHCSEPRVARVRAVLSWNAPPSTTDPDALPVWGNRLDTHVRILPGATGDPTVPTTWVTLIGGVNVTTSAATSGIHPTTGLTTANAVFADLGVMAGTERPFGGWIVVRGPSLPGYDYRVLKRPAGGVWSPMTDGFRVTNQDGTLGPIVTPSVDGTVSYLPKTQNFTNLLGRFRPAGDELWEIQLEVIDLGLSPIYPVQLDNTKPTVNIAITSPGGTCGKFPVETTIQGVFDVNDIHLRHWNLAVPDPDPTDTFGVNPVVPASGSAPQPPGTPWQLATKGMRACGYNIVLNAWDRAILDSQSSPGNHAQTRAGFCLD